MRNCGSRTNERARSRDSTIRVFTALPLQAVELCIHVATLRKRGIPRRINARFRPNLPAKCARLAHTGCAEKDSPDLIGECRSLQLQPQTAKLRAMYEHIRSSSNYTRNTLSPLFQVDLRETFRNEAGRFVTVNNDTFPHRMQASLSTRVPRWFRENKHSLSSSEVIYNST